ncbi:MAG: hypothetical protein JO086_01940 [Acidimicrobiia bacterium]|nr:hypothetical protein [Acidimicrobiia bacterium]
MAERRTRPSAVALVAALAGAVLLVVSAFLVWGSLDIGIGTISEKGTDSSAGVAVIVLAVGVVAVLVGSFARLPRRFVRGAWALFGVAAIGLGIYALIQINNAPTDFFAGVTSAIKDSGVSGLLGNLGIDQKTVKDAASQIVSVNYGPGVFVAMAGGVATLVAALALNRREG